MPVEAPRVGSQRLICPQSLNTAGLTTIAKTLMNIGSMRRFLSVKRGPLEVAGLDAPTRFVNTHCGVNVKNAVRMNTWLARINNSSENVPDHAIREAT